MSGRDVTHLFDRVASGEDSATVRADLRRVARVRGDRNVVQVGDHNIALHDAHDIHIDNRIYHGAEAEAIRRALQDVVVTQAPERLRGVGGVLTTLGVVVALGDFVVHRHWALQFVYYAAVGILWAWPAKWLMFWAAGQR